MSTQKGNLLPIWQDETSGLVKVIDQRELPHDLVILDLNSVDDAIMAIKEMVVRGAPLIGITAAYGVYIGAADAASASGCRP